MKKNYLIITAIVAAMILTQYSFTDKAYAAVTESQNFKTIIGTDRYETAALISKDGWSSGADTVFLVNGEAIADGLTATPLASLDNGPILMTDKDSLPDYTKNEIARLNPKTVILVGGTGVISDSIISRLKSILPNIEVQRIGGRDRYDTCLKIAEEIAKKNTINTAYFAYGYGEPDALSIAAKAGYDKQPIILTETAAVPADTLTWLKGKNIADAYFIGGPGVISSNVINQVDSIIPANVSGNRVYGNDRHDTNAKVIEKFYPGNQLSSLMVAKSDILVDALTAGPYAAKHNSPVLLVNSNLSLSQGQILDRKIALSVIQVGGGVGTASVQSARDRVSSVSDGTYKVGRDIEPGEYVVYQTDPTYSGYWELNTDGTDNNIIANEIVEGRSIVTIQTGQYFKVSRGRVVPISIAPKADFSNNQIGPGMYKVGYDIPAGEYRLVADSDNFGGYVAVYNDSKHVDIIYNDIIKGTGYATVKSGQYIILSRCNGYLEAASTSDTGTNTGTDINTGTNTNSNDPYTDDRFWYEYNAVEQHIESMASALQNSTYSAQLFAQATQDSLEAIRDEHMSYASSRPLYKEMTDVINSAIAYNSDAVNGDFVQFTKDVQTFQNEVSDLLNVIPTV